MTDNLTTTENKSDFPLTTKTDLGIALKQSWFSIWDDLANLNNYINSILNRLAGNQICVRREDINPTNSYNKTKAPDFSEAFVLLARQAFNYLTTLLKIII